MHFDQENEQVPADYDAVPADALYLLYPFIGLCITTGFVALIVFLAYARP